MEKRFSMNFLDTVDSPAKKIYLDLLEHPLSKRFSMNFLDTLDKPKRKRFTMNFMDTLGAEQRGYLAKHQSSHHRREENGKNSCFHRSLFFIFRWTQLILQNADKKQNI